VEGTVCRHNLLRCTGEDLALPCRAGKQEIASGCNVTFTAARLLPDRGMMTDAVEKVDCENSGVPAWLMWQILGLVQALGLALGASASTLTPPTDATQLMRRRAGVAAG
jgi:hypothetical protein